MYTRWVYASYRIKSLKNSIYNVLLQYLYHVLYFWSIFFQGASRGFMPSAISTAHLASKNMKYAHKGAKIWICLTACQLKRIVINLASRYQFSRPNSSRKQSSTQNSLELTTPQLLSIYPDGNRTTSSYPKIINSWRWEGHQIFHNYIVEMYPEEEIAQISPFP